MKKIVFLIALLVISLSGNVVTAAPPGQSPDGEEYVVQADDWLSKIALKYYDDMSAYPAIVEATNAKATEDDSFRVIDNPDLIEIGQKLWLPATADVVAQPGGPSPTEGVETVAPGVQCADFLDVPTGVLPGSVFEKNGFLFGHVPPGDLLVDDFSAGPGLRVSGSGTVLRIEWPASALMVNVTAGSWSGASLNVSAFDGVGNQVGSTVEILPMGDVLTIGFNGQDIHIIEIVGGGNEGLLTEICICHL